MQGPVCLLLSVFSFVNISHEASQFCICSHLLIWTFSFLRAWWSYTVCRNSTSKPHISHLCLGICPHCFLWQYFSIYPSWSFLCLLNSTRTSILMAKSSPHPSLEQPFRQYQHAMERKAEPKWCKIFWLVHSGLLGPFGKTGAQDNLEKSPSSTKSMPVYLLTQFTSFLHWFRHFPVLRLSVTAPQLFPFLWLMNCINIGVCSLLSLYHFMSQNVSLGESFHTYLMTLRILFFTKHNMYCNCKYIRPNGVPLTYICLVLYCNKMCNIISTSREVLHVEEIVV